MDTFSKIVANVGFPIAVAGFLLFNIEKKIDKLNEMLIKIMELFAAQKD